MYHVVGIESFASVVEFCLLTDGKIKRSYIRTKLAEDKPVDMLKLMVPFEYGWRRETRLRGINKNGRMIGEVFYYTPNDKRMRSFNEVKRFLEADKLKYEKLEAGVRHESDVEMEDEADKHSDSSKQQYNENCKYWHIHSELSVMTY